MTPRENIIRLAKLANDVHIEDEKFFDLMERFAALVTAEKDAEIERKMSAGQHLIKEIAARDLVIQQMREALQIYVDFGKANGSDAPRAEEALSLQPTTSALDAYVTERVAEEREAIAKWYEEDGWLLDEMDVPTAIRARTKPE